MAAMTVTAAPPAMTPRSAGPGVMPSFILRYMDRPVSYEAKPSPFDTVLLNCKCQHNYIQELIGDRHSRYVHPLLPLHSELLTSWKPQHTMSPVCARVQLGKHAAL